MIWTEEQTDKLLHLAKSGLTGSQIGKELGCTKNSVIGKLNRLGLDAHAYPRKGKFNDRKECESPEQLAEWGRSAVNKRWASTPRRETKPPLPKVEKIATLIVSNAVSAPLSKALLIDALTERHCRWIDGHPSKDAPTHYCGLETLPGTSWCAYHHPRAVRKTTAEGADNHFDRIAAKALGRQPKGDRELLVVEAA